MIKIRMPPNAARSVNGKSVYLLYLMLKNHFAGKYDVIKYHWVMRISDQAYQKRRDKFFFEKLSDKYKLNELTLIFMSNLVANQDAWIGDISDADALIFYREYIGKLRSMNTQFEDDIKNIYYFAKKVEVENFGDIFKYQSKVDSSYIFKLLQSNVISFESFILLDSFMDIINKHDEQTNNLVWSNYSTRLKAYKKLLEIDSSASKALFIDVVKKCKS